MGGAAASSDLGEWFSPPLPAPIRGLVRARHAYRMPVPAGEWHVGMPQPYLPFIISLGPEHRIVDIRARRRHVVDSFVAGLGEHASLVGAEEFAGVQVDLTPVAARRLFGSVVADLGGSSAHVGELLGRDGVHLEERLRSAADWRSRIDIVDAWLVRRLAEPDDLAPELVHAWELLYRSGGLLPVGAVARSVGWSERHLRRRFTAAFGVGPKVAARVVRLDRAWRSIEPGADVNLAEVAATYGYADHAHLTNEVREMTGFTPTTLLAGHRAMLRAMVSGSSKPARAAAP